MPRTIAILATLDTKGAEADFIRDQVQARGHRALIIDTGLMGDATVAHDISNR